MATETLLCTFRFQVNLRASRRIDAGVLGSAIDKPQGTPPVDESAPDRLGTGGFQDCKGLDISMDVQQLKEGGRNDGVIQRLGRATYTNVILRRGMFFGSNEKLNTDLWGWLQAILGGAVPVVRYDGSIQVLDRERVIATWTFVRGVPAAIRGPSLDAKTGDIAIEEIEIAHEGLQLELA